MGESGVVLLPHLGQDVIFHSMGEIEVRQTTIEIVDDLTIHREALGNLPQAPEGSDPFFALAAAFLVSYPPNTARAHTNDLNAWAAWCAEAGVHPFHVRRHHVDNWIRHMTQQPQAAPENRLRRPPLPGGCRA